MMTDDEFDIVMKTAKSEDMREQVLTTIFLENGVALAEQQGVANAQAEIIAKQNDAFRRCFQFDDAKKYCRDHQIGGKCVSTLGVRNLGPIAPLLCFRMVAEFDEFSPENDPYGERDFGSFQFLDVRILFKIDYYDTDYKHGSEDASNPEKTRRVLTIMLSSEF